MQYMIFYFLKNLPCLKIGESKSLIIFLSNFSPSCQKKEADNGKEMKWCHSLICQKNRLIWISPIRTLLLKILIKNTIC